MSSTGYSLGQMTAIDTSDIPGWLERAQRDLGEAGFGTLAVLRETGSVLDLTARLVVGGNARSASLTIYKTYGRVRIAADGDAESATRLEALIADELELVVATRLTTQVIQPTQPERPHVVSGARARTFTRTIGLGASGARTDSGWTDESGRETAEIPAAIAAEIDQLLN